MLWRGGSCPTPAARHSPRRLRAGASITPAVCNSLSRAARAPCRSRVTPLPRFSRRRKRGPTPVLWSERRRRVGRGDHSSLPRETAISQLAGRAIVEAVVCRLTDRDEIPGAPLPAREVLDRVDMMHGRRQLAAAVARGIAAIEFIAPQHRIAQAQPALTLVVHEKTKSAKTSQRRSWRSCHPAITSAAKQKRQTIYRLHGQIIWRWL